MSLRVVTFIVFPLLFLTSTSSQAYIGPGAGLSAIGTVLAFLAAVALAIIGFVWYPMKRLRRKMAKKNTTPEKNVPTVEEADVDKIAEEDHSKQ